MDNDIETAIIREDTREIMDRAYTYKEIVEGVYWCESPIFDTLAADRFASDVTTFNLGDYR